MQKKKSRHDELKYISIAKIFAGKHYVSFDTMERYLSPYGCLRSTLHCYLAEWKKQKKIFSAGRGWYSDIAQPLQLDSSELEKYVSFLNGAFPLLEFKCWSTRQLTNFHQHLPLRFSTFIYVDRYSMTDVADALKEKMPEEPVFIQPILKSGRSLPGDGSRIVIRSLSYDDQQTPESFILSPEAVLVDYAIESERLMLIDSTEFRMVFENILQTGRINISALLRRISHRKTENPNINTIFNIIM